MLNNKKKVYTRMYKMILKIEKELQNLKAIVGLNKIVNEDKK